MEAGGAPASRLDQLTDGPLKCIYSLWIQQNQWTQKKQPDTDVFIESLFSESVCCWEFMASVCSHICVFSDKTPVEQLQDR